MLIKSKNALPVKPAGWPNGPFTKCKNAFIYQINATQSEISKRENSSTNFASFVILIARLDRGIEKLCSVDQ